MVQKQHVGVSLVPMQRCVFRLVCIIAIIDTCRALNQLPALQADLGVLCRIGGVKGVPLSTLHLHYRGKVLSGEGACCVACPLHLCCRQHQLLGAASVGKKAYMPPPPAVERMRGESLGHIRVFGGPDAEAAIGAMRLVLRGAQEGRFSHEPATATSPETWGVHSRCRGALLCCQ